MENLIEKLVKKLIDDGLNTKEIIQELTTKYEYTKNSANSLIKRVRKSMGIFHNNDQNHYEDYENNDEDEFVGGKVRSVKKKKFQD